MQLTLKFLFVAMVLSLPLLASPALAQAPYAVGTTKEEVIVIAKGWSVKKDILSKDVFTDEGKEKVGTIEDIIVTPDKNFSYAVISTGGFLGIAKHDVVVPVNQLKVVGKRIVLPGATKETVKALPEFKYVE